VGASDSHISVISMDSTTPPLGEASLQPSADVSADDLREIPGCCVVTIHQHARHNPMMVCSECKQIIKCFQDERAFANYLTFCKSRRRPVLTGRVESLYTVVFRSYETAFGNRL
jgi:hypothetical protein